jgi:hypothetical protein
MATSRPADLSRTLTQEELLALPAVIDLEMANRALAIGRSTGYSLAKQNRYPAKLLRLGNTYRVVTADLLRILEIGRSDAESAVAERKAGPGASGDMVGGRSPERLAS